MCVLDAVVGEKVGGHDREADQERAAGHGAGDVAKNASCLMAGDVVQGAHKKAA